MKLKQGIIKKLTENLDQEYGCIYDSYKTRIYELQKNKIIIVTKERAKYEYYKYALEYGFVHIPKIYDLVRDVINGVYVIQREELYPITDHKKLTRLEIVQNALRNDAEINDKIVKEVLQFYDDTDYSFDFGPHCFMQTKNGKIVVSDIFKD